MAQFNEAALKGFLDILTEAANGLIGAVSTSLQTVSLLGAHFLAGLSQDSNIIGSLGELIGKRETKDFWSDLGDAALSLLSTTANSLLGPLTLTAAQLLAQFSQVGLPSIGRRGIFDDLLDSVTNSLLATANQLAGDLALQLAIALATFSTTGGLLGKRDAKGFLDSLTDAFNQIYDTVLLPALNTQITNISLLGAHLLAGLSQETDVLSALGNLLGKREVKGIFDDLLDSLTSSLTTAANSLLGDLALQAAIALAQFSTTGGLFGK